MTISAESIQAVCPKCKEPMRRERDGVRAPPMPEIFWFCTNQKCEDGKSNKVFSGG